MPREPPPHICTCDFHCILTNIKWVKIRRVWPIWAWTPYGRSCGSSKMDFPPKAPIPVLQTAVTRTLQAQTEFFSITHHRWLTHTLSEAKPSTWVWVDTSGFEVNSSILQLDYSVMVLPLSPSTPPLSAAPGKQSGFPWDTVPRLPSPVSQEGRLSSGIWVSYPRQAEAQACCVCRSAWRAAILIARYNCGFYYLLGGKMGDIKAGVSCQMLELNALLIWLASVTWALNEKHL